MLQPGARMVRGKEYRVDGTGALSTSRVGFRSDGHVWVFSGGSGGGSGVMVSLCACKLSYLFS